VNWAVISLSACLSAQVCLLSLILIYWIGCNLSAWVWCVSSAVVCELRCKLSAQQLLPIISTLLTVKLIRCALVQVYTLLVSAQLQLVNSAVSSAATWEPSCQHRVQLSAQLHSVSRLNPLPRLNSILPPKLWAVLLVATNQSRVHAVTVHCTTRPVQSTTCVPSLSNTMILQGVYNHPMRNEQKRPVSSMQVSQPQTWTQKDMAVATQMQ